MDFFRQFFRPIPIKIVSFSKCLMVNEDKLQPWQNHNKMACAPSEDSASAQSDQSLCCLHEESLGP